MANGELAVVAASIFSAAIVYMVAGFGFALLAMPLMTLVLPVERAVVIVALLAALSTTWQAIAHRHHVDRRVAARLTLAAYAGMPLGLVALNVADDRTMRLVLGVGVIVATVLLVRRIDLSGRGSGLDVAMGFVSGAANTSLGTNGPPMVFALQARGVAPAVFLGTISVVFAASNVVTLSLFAIDGKVTADGLRAAAIAFPAWLLGSIIGRRVQRRVPAGRFRRLVLTLLFTTGATTILFALA